VSSCFTTVANLGTRGNIDHIVVSPTGIFVVDAKRHKGLIPIRNRGGFLGSDDRLYVGSRDCSDLVDIMAWQTKAVKAVIDTAELLRSGKTKKHNNGPTKPHHVLVAEAADSAGESCALDGGDLVNHDAALLAKTIRRGRLDCEPNQGSLCWVGCKRANRYGIRGVEAIILYNDDRPWLARVSGSASGRPDLAALQASM
jgi:hypothetical protein